MSVPETTATVRAQDEAIAALIAQWVEATQTAVAGGGDGNGGDFGEGILDAANVILVRMRGDPAVPLGVGMGLMAIAATVALAISKKLAIAKIAKLALRLLL